jgi:hypothetical protein
VSSAQVLDGENVSNNNSAVTVVLHTLFFISDCKIFPALRSPLNCSCRLEGAASLEQTLLGVAPRGKVRHTCCIWEEWRALEMPESEAPGGRNLRGRGAACAHSTRLLPGCYSHVRVQAGTSVNA